MPFRTHHALVILLLALTQNAIAAQVDVRIDGIVGNLMDNASAGLSIMRYRSLPDLTDAMVHRMHARAPREIREALVPFGYYEARVTSTLELLNGTWVARYSVTPGDPVRVREVDVRVDGVGKDEAAFSLRGLLPLTGDRLRHPDYERLKQVLREAAAELGYLDSRFTQSELRVSVEERAADIIVHFETGERYRFGTISLEQDVLDDDVLRRWIPFEAGDPFNLTQLLRLQYALADSEYFSQVEVDASRRLARGLDIPVEVRMQPAPQHRYTVGVGYATDTGPRGIAGWENRRVNHRGHRFSSELKLSSVYQSLTARYLVPLDNPVWERLTLTSSIVQEELGDVDSDRAELAIAWTTREGPWQRTLGGKVLREEETQLIPSAEWTYTGGETGARPRDASRLHISLSGSAPALGAAVGYLQMRARGRLIFPVGEDDRLLLRAELGVIATGAITLVAPSQRFFAGGDFSVRGYRFNSLGPRDGAGDVVGGKLLATFGVEWEHWLSERWGVAVFADHGNAFNTLDDRLSTGAGVGLRWQLPFAVFALDVAHPFDDPGGRSMRLHLTLGVDL